MYNGKKIIALLPMKAHSERVNNKNFKCISGKPLYHWIIDSLVETGIIDSIVINTDSDCILKNEDLLKSEKFIVRKRKEKLCGDFISMNSVLKDDILNVDSDIYLMTHTTNPLLSSNTINEAVKIFINNSGKYDSLFSVNKFQTRFYKIDGKAINHDPDNLIRTQDLEPWYEENSCLYLFTKESFLKTNARIGKRPYLYLTPKVESIEIDTTDDWDIARILLNNFKNQDLRKGINNG